MTQLENQTQREPLTGTARLRRSQTDKVIAGVCGGLGRYFGVDPIWFRLAFIILAIGGGSGVLLYIIGWIVMPVEGEDSSTVSAELGKQGPLVAGVVLVGVGLVFLANNLAPWFNQFMWPAAVIAAGAGLIYTGRRREHT